MAGRRRERKRERIKYVTEIRLVSGCVILAQELFTTMRNAPSCRLQYTFAPSCATGRLSHMSILSKLFGGGGVRFVRKYSEKKQTPIGICNRRSCKFSINNCQTGFTESNAGIPRQTLSGSPTCPQFPDLRQECLRYYASQNLL